VGWNVIVLIVLIVVLIVLIVTIKTISFDRDRDRFDRVFVIV
jgi:uncharacterized membrane protein